jgi:hypothetical protein
MAGMSWTAWAGTAAVPIHDQSTLRGRMIQIGSPPSTRRSSSILSPGPTSSSSHKRRGKVAWRFAVNLIAAMRTGYHVCLTMVRFSKVA